MLDANNRWDLLGSWLCALSLSPSPSPASFPCCLLPALLLPLLLLLLLLPMLLLLPLLLLLLPPCFPFCPRKKQGQGQRHEF